MVVVTLTIFPYFGKNTIFSQLNGGCDPYKIFASSKYSIFVAN